MSSRIYRDGLLRGRRALITGGATGIGAACARELSHLGAEVVISGRRKPLLEDAARHLSEETGTPVHARACDIRDREHVRSVVNGICEELGPIDILVNNGGGQFLSPAEGIRDKGWDAVIQTNLTGTWNLTRAVADACMLARGGRVISITMLTDRGFPGMAHSVAARAGVEAMNRTLAVEWARRGIRLNAIQPGIVGTNALNRYPGGLELATGIQAQIPAGRLGTADEIAWLVALLAGPAGDYITGQTLTVDGGRALWGDTWPMADIDPLPTVTLSRNPWEPEPGAT